VREVICVEVGDEAGVIRWTFRRPLDVIDPGGVDA
jgi:hypothetical protein